MQEVVQDHVQPLRARPRAGRWPVVKVLAFSLTSALRFWLRARRAPSPVALGTHMLEEYWRRIFRTGNAKLVVEGREHFDGRPSIVMSNHASLLDIPAMLGAVPGPMRMVMKQELGRVPIWGPAVVAAGFIPIDREHRDRAVVQLDVAKQMHAQGMHVWISPEGTRERGRGLLPFKRGGFHLAAQTGSPIVPAYIEGTSAVAPPDTFRVLEDGVITVRFGPPIETRGRAIDDVMEETRLAIAALAERSSGA